jgi:hypothetical protein
MFFGVTRFSLLLPNSNAWYLSKDLYNDTAIEEYKARLFSPTRLDERIEIFFNLVVPSLNKMKGNHNYYHILQISEELPNHYKLKILELVSKYDFLLIQEVNKFGNSKTTLNEIILDKTKELKNNENIFGLFYLDDDDILSIDYLDKVKKYIYPEFQGYIISFANGITGLLQKSTSLNTKNCYQPKINIGLMRIGYISEKNEVILPIIGNHKYSDKFSPTILDSREIMYYWTRHLNQDSSRSFDDYYNQINIILKDLNKFEDVNLSNEIKEKFPLLNFSSDSDNKKEEIILNQIIDDRGFVVNFEPISKKAHISLNINKEQSTVILDKERALIVSFIFDKKCDNVPGLSKSSNEDIGFFSYVPLTSEKLSEKFQMTLVMPPNVNLKGLKIKKWKVKGNVKISEVNIS